MHYLFTKKTFLGWIGILLMVSTLLYSGSAYPVDAEGGNHNFVPIVIGAADVLAGETTIFGPNATWKYYDKGAVPGSGWNQPGFGDASWASGSAPLGYGKGTERTVISYGSNANNKFITTYFRKTVSIADASTISSLAIDLLFNDGAVVYLNGREVARTNMPSGTASYSTLAASCLQASGPATLSIDKSGLVSGNNTLAVEVHQWNASSADLEFGMVLRAVSGTGTAPTSPPPAQPTPTVIPTSTSPAQPTPTARPTTQPTAQPTVPPTTGRSYYVTTGGSSSGDGSSSRPWSLAHALSMPSVLRPGDTIWVRGGSYSGSFTVKIKGSSSAPITVRAYPGERATLRNSNSYVLDIAGCSYLNFWGLEIAGSASTRNSPAYEGAYGIRVNQGTSSNNVKFINMVIHDVQSQGMGWWQALVNSEVYGSLVYFNGTNKLDHGVYVHNVNGTKYLVNNIVFDNASHGLHGYAETAEKGLNNIVVDGNTFFNNGSIGGTMKRNILVGGLTRANNPVITNNYTYYSGSSGQALNLGYNAGSSGAKVTNNYFAGGQFQIGGGYSSLSMSGNFAYAPGGFTGFSTGSFSGNTWTTSKPSGVKVFVRPNKYETNRANITIFNWSRQSTVSVPAANLAGVNIKAGASYELRNAQNFYGDVITGVFDGTAIKVPMTGRSVAQPGGGISKPASTFPEFGAFVLIVK